MKQTKILPKIPWITTLVLVLISQYGLKARPSDEQNWNQWGGGNRNFNIKDSGLADQWPEEGPPELWSRNLGEGNSGILFNDGILYTQYRKRSGSDASEKDEHILALHAGNGTVIWDYRYPASPLPEQEQYGGGIGPHATPLIRDEHLIALGYTGQLHALDRHRGNLIWKHDLVEDFGAEPVQFGFSASPLGVDSKVIVQAAGKKSGLLALDVKTGALIWKSPAAGFSYASPILIKWWGRIQVVWMTGNEVEGVDLDSGKSLWRYPLRKKGLTNVPTPLWMGDGYLLIAGQGVADTQLIRLPEDTGENIEIRNEWRSGRMKFFHSNALRLGDYVFGGDSFFYGFNWKNGRRSMSERGFAQANMVQVGEKTILLTKEGQLMLAHLTPGSINVLSSFQFSDGNAWTVPTIVGTRLFVRDRRVIAAFNLGQSGPENDRTVLKRIPSVRQVQNLIANLVKKGNMSRVSEVIRNYQEEFPDLLDEYLLMDYGAQLLESGKMDQGVQLLSENHRLFPESRQALHAIARAVLTSGDQKTALGYYQQLQRQFPSFPGVAEVIAQLDPDVNRRTNSRFQLKGHSNARMVSVAGSFNDWDPYRTPMIKQGKEWHCGLNLPAGTHTYKFVVDGEWMIDPDNTQKTRDQNGNVNSVMIIK